MEVGVGLGMGVQVGMDVGRAIGLRVGTGIAGPVRVGIGTGEDQETVGLTVRQGEGAMGWLKVIVKSKSFFWPFSQVQS